MKKLVALLLCLGLLGTSMAALAADGEKTVINLYAFTREVPEMAEKFLAMNPDIAEAYEFNPTVISTDAGTSAYEAALDLALLEGTVDLYVAEAAFILKYAQGDAAPFAAPYKDLGIDVDAKLAEADIAGYTVEIGTNPNGDLVALGYQATGGAFIYRRSIAIDTWGTDDPEEIAAKVGPGWEQFLVAAEELKAKGYGIVSGDGDMWNVIEKGSETGWIVDGKLNIDPAREAYLDYSKSLTDNGYSNITQAWNDAWFADMAGSGEKPIFGFFGPAWLINYVLVNNCGDTFGDWAVCVPPVGFFWGGSWLVAADASPNKEVLGKFIEWVTLDSSDTGLQYFWANGIMVEGEVGTKDCVASGAVMAKSNGEVALLGDQNMFDVFVPANAFASGKAMTQYDGVINNQWQTYARMYAAGEISREDAIANFRQWVADNLDVIVE